MDASNPKDCRYVDDFMTKEEEEYKVPYPVIKDRDAFNQK